MSGAGEGAAKPAAAPAPRTGWMRHALLAWPWPLHLFVAPIPPILGFVHDNRLVLLASDTTGALLYAWTLELLLVAILSPILRSVRTAAFLVSGATVLFFSHGVFNKALKTALADAGSLAAWAPWGETVAWSLLGLLLLFFLVRPRSGEVLTTFANVFAVFALFSPLKQLYDDESPAHVPAPAVSRFDLIVPPPAAAAKLPDVWYIVLDGYGREDVLKDMYDYDSPLPEALKERGFVVPSKARSNYVQTALSFSSTLNLSFMPDLLDDESPAQRDRWALRELCGDNVVVRTLRGAGYRVVEYAGEYSFTRLQQSDERRAPWVHFTEFEYMLVHGTTLEPLSTKLGLPQSWVAHQIRRYHVPWVIEGLIHDDTPRMSDPSAAPTFTFAHIVAPHPPFVWEADGGYRKEKTRAAFADGSGWKGIARPFREKYEAGYRPQIQWLDGQVVRIVDAILARSPDAVILIQGDHGPGAHLEWGSAEKTDVRERTGIIAAYRIPDGSVIPEDMTPVNSFRVLFNQLLGSDLPMLPNKSWYTSWGSPYRFVDVTDRLAREEATRAAAAAPAAPTADTDVAPEQAP